MVGRIVGIGPQLGGPVHTVRAVGFRSGQIGGASSPAAR